MAVWNEAMYYFVAAPTHYRKVLFILRSVKNGETLGQHYLKRFEHLIPQDVEIWEYDPATEATVLINRPEAQGQWQNHLLHKSGTES